MASDDVRQPIGRPTIFDKDVFDLICERLAGGETLRRVCRDVGMPSEVSVRRWVMQDYQGVSAQYARARELGFEALADETLDIADDGSNDWVQRTRRDGSTETVLDREHVERSKLRVGQRNWLLGRLARNVYGDRTPKADDPAGGSDTIVITGGLPRDADD